MRGGTPPYMPPEHLGIMKYCQGPWGTDAQPTDDIYALGVVAHQLLSGSAYAVTDGEVRAFRRIVIGRPFESYARYLCIGLGLMRVRVCAAHRPSLSTATW